MIDIEAAKTKAKKRYDDTIKALSVCACFPDFVDHVSDDTIFLSHTNSITEFKAQLNHIRKHNMELTLSRYYMSGNDIVVVVYSTPDIDFSFYCSDYVAVLNSISKGKCHVEEIEYTKKSIVCKI